MKKIINVLFAAAVSAFAMTSCTEKEIVTYNPDVAVVPALEAIAESYVLTDGGEFATLNFSAAEFGIPTAARYTAYADINEDFSTKQSLGNVATDTAGITISANTLNNALMSLNCEHSVPVTVYFRIEAQMMGESSPVQTVTALVSNTILRPSLRLMPRRYILQYMSSEHSADGIIPRPHSFSAMPRMMKISSV